MAAKPQTKPTVVDCESAGRLLSPTSTIAIYYFYSSRKLILIYRPTEDGRLSRIISRYPGADFADAVGAIGLVVRRMQKN